jgi:hypothetical protein
MRKSILTALAIGMGLVGCATESKQGKDRIEFGTNKATLQVGDTSGLWTVSKTLIEPNGRESTTDPYTFFQLESSDTTVASVILKKQLVAKKAGETQITARDEKSALKTENAITVTVTAKP